jgi:hypothetical protein
MSKLAREGQTHPAVRRYAESIVRRVYPKDYLSELAALYYATAATVRYTRDPANAEFVQHPAIVLRHRAGDCDDMAIVQRSALGAVPDRYGALVGSVGNHADYVTCGFNRKRPNKHTHVFLRVYVPSIRKYVIMDPVAGPATRQMIRRCAGYRAYPT